MDVDSTIGTMVGSIMESFSKTSVMVEEFSGGRMALRTKETLFKVNEKVKDDTRLAMVVTTVSYPKNDRAW
jgi:hypothetical protein